MVFNSAGAVVSPAVQLTVLAPVRFTVQPANQLVQPGATATLNAAAVGTGTLRWQWRFEGNDISGATNASHSFTNANLEEHHGLFSVAVWDDISTAVSTNARVFVAVRPGIVDQPGPQTVIQGGTARFTLYATGAPPLYYRWLRSGVLVVSNTFPEFVITNVQFSHAGNYRVQVGNLAGTVNSSPGSGVALTVLADSDGDGMADVWEAAFGFNTNSASDALLDLDGDGMSNRDEYIAGTNPTDPASLLKVFTTGDAALINFVAQSNLSYSVQFRTNLTSDAWRNLTNIAAQSGVRTVELNAPNLPGAPERFLRVVTPQQ
jgi:hypothetical protein